MHHLYLQEYLSALRMWVTALCVLIMCGVCTGFGGPTLYEAIRSGSTGKKAAKGKKGKAKKAGKGKGKNSKKMPDAVGQRKGVGADLKAFDLASPKGFYTLNLSHPVQALLLKELMKYKGDGPGSRGKEILSFENITVNGKTIKPVQLEALNGGSDLPVCETVLAFDVDAPAVIPSLAGRKIPKCVLDWVVHETTQRSTKETWKRELAVLLSRTYILESKEVLTVGNQACEHFLQLSSTLPAY